MATVPYAPPQITAAGLSVPLYPSILQLLVTSYQGIFGANTYLGPDSLDFQQLSVFAKLISDVMSLGQLIYNNRAPGTAVGSALDSLIKFSGMVRIGATPSTVNVNLTGDPNFTIVNGVVQDVNGIYWNLPSAVTLSNSGTASAPATCQTAGAISVAAGQVTAIQNPQSGWNSVTNPAAANVGQAAESDSHVRARQALSVAIPSITMLAGTIADIQAIPGIGRNQCIENPMGVPDTYGNPAHSLACVVELGSATAAQVAQAIYDNRGIGPQTFSCATSGTTPVTVNIPVPGSSAGLTFPCNFATPAYIPIYVSLTLNPLTNWLTTYPALVQAAIVSYLNSLQIGENVTLSALYYTAMSVMPNTLLPAFSITSLKLGTSASPTGTTDISMTFGQVAQGIAGNIVITS